VKLNVATHPTSSLIAVLRLRLNKDIAEQSRRAAFVPVIGPPACFFKRRCSIGLTGMPTMVSYRCAVKRRNHPIVITEDNKLEEFFASQRSDVFQLTILNGN